jgi:hypothetical protein
MGVNRMQERGSSKVYSDAVSALRDILPRAAVADPPDPQNDLLLRRREQGISSGNISPASSSSNSIRRARSPSASAPAAPASRPSSPRPARHPGRRRQGARSTASLCLGAGWSPTSRSSSLEGRYRGQPRLSQDRAQLQSEHGDRGPRSRSPRSSIWSSRRARSRPHHTPGIYVKRIIHAGKNYRETHREAHGAPARRRRRRQV